jgi:hypothetical protein
MNETVCWDEVPSGDLALDANARGISLPTQREWRAVWEGSGLVDRTLE